MSTAIDYRQQLLEEISGLSQQDLAKIYKMIVLLKQEFIEPDEERYYSSSWIQAEQEATEAYQRGGLPRFHSVRELAEHIESGIDE